jgi:delta 1-pyrroline-5-carboxylate dehydrogenase
MKTKKNATKQASTKTSKAKTTSTKAKATIPQAKKKTPAVEPAKTLSQINAAIGALAEARELTNCEAVAEAMQAKGYWTSPGGKTPDATLCASILRDLGKGKEARFAKADRRLFTLAGKKK